MFTFALLLAMTAPPRPYLHAPSVSTYAVHNPAGTTILSNGRLLKPIGKHYPVGKWPYGLVSSRDGAAIFVASDGTGLIVRDWMGGTPSFAPVVPSAPGQPNRKLNAGGADFSPDGRTLYWSGGDGGTIMVFDAATGERQGDVPLDVPIAGKPYEDSYVVDVLCSADGRHLYGADVANFRLVVIDTTTRAIVASIRVGRYPYALAASGSRVYVANIGLFEYSAIPPLKPGAEGTIKGKDGRASLPDPRGLSFPPFGYPSREARDGVEMEGRWIPGLGEPNVPESFSVWGVDVSNPRSPKIVSKLKTGLLVGAHSDNGKTVGGSAPNFLVARGNSLWVSNGNNDMIERIDLKKNRIAVSRRLVPSPLVASVRGVAPAGMALSPDGKRLYVTEMGINSVAVLDATTLRTLGRYPTPWYPYRVVVSRDGRKTAHISFRGFGNGPNAGKSIPKSEFLNMRGALTIANVPTDRELPTLTQRVLNCNGIVDRSSVRKAMSSPVIPGVLGKASEEIRYVVFITKENHTYDAIFDRVPGAKHDPSLLRWGLSQTVSASGQPTLENVPVMVNHNALARQFTLSDNFYMEPEMSGVGHRWLVGVQPNNLMQMTYTVGWDFKVNSTAPGRRYAMGSNGSLIPEDYPEAGSMWEHLARHGITFRNYGEGFELPGVDEGEGMHRTGGRQVVNIPMSKVLYDSTCRDYPIFNMNIPDQYRAHWFIQDIEQNYLAKKKPLPRFLNITLPNDHGTGTRPDRGYPYLASWMADNDLALGRIVEFLSRTPYWKNMAIFVTQDDSGGEPDHIDSQRSVLMIISPWARRGYVSHRHTTIVSMHRTLYSIFGLPPLNMFDALANDFSDCFTTRPDYRPYTCVPVDPRIFDPEKAKDPTDPDYARARTMPTVRMDDEDEMERVLILGGGVPETK
ncbi:MAG: PD40 domain-containing protein [Chthonomonadales bacterium]|nr:PD40 domain-containing protein [Chthonomonadales bacterium]